MPKPRDAKGLRAVATSVNKVVRPIWRKRGLADASLVTDWPAIVGPDLAGQCHPQRLVRKRDDSGGTLHVVVAGPLALELQHLAPQVIERINAYFGYQAVGRLRLHQGPIKRPTQQRKPVPETSEPPGLADRLTSVDDPDLKRALHSLGRAVLARKGAKDQINLRE